ncbi:MULTISPECIES: cbb3-type cytochrome oxidase assembly protein CcoS [unclassified Moraxella]|uniref:cbb3-type cytochrome oxidase assembly protein CcoS n=1 Tax=unclassified Moraxella TaxID=2685852 RepID=UPI003AF9A35E
MQSMYFLVPLSLILFVFGIFAIYYAVKSRQFDDLDNESQRVILDDRQFRREQLQDTEETPSENRVTDKPSN